MRTEAAVLKRTVLTSFEDDFRTIGLDAILFIKNNQQFCKYIGVPDSTDHGSGLVTVSSGWFFLLTYPLLLQVV